jgi:hypothetical protein
VLREQAAEPTASLLSFSVDGGVQHPSSLIAAAYLASSPLGALGLTVVDASMRRIAGSCGLSSSTPVGFSS